MTITTPEHNLVESIRTLRAFARDMEQGSATLRQDLSQRLSRLQAAVASLGQVKPAKSVHCPEEYIKQWTRFREEEKQPIEHRAIRYLCWQPEIAASQPFQYYLDHKKIDLNARSLQGLVRSCHALWSPDFANSQVVTRIRDRLETYRGTNRLLARWKENLSMILGSRGSAEFGVEMVQRRCGIKAHCESWGIGDNPSAYVQAAVRHATQVCRDQMDRVRELRQYLIDELMPWEGWVPSLFKQEVGQAIGHPSTALDEEVRASVQQFILDDSRLGDPRLPRNRLNWAGMIDAERRVVEWLSRLDIVFFFESVLPKSQDPQGRKEFWLRYIPSIKRSRPLLRREDRDQLHRDLRQKGLELAHVGSMDDWATASTFLLDFGELLVIEFSETGNACYIYGKNDVDKVIPDFWTSKPFVQRQLRRRDLPHQRIVHRQRKNPWHRGGWEEETAQILARFGIRPGKRG